ncbi:MAG: N-acetylglucosamine-6-phosphate deacetylase [Gammaproteobacteria bacterium]|nr:MAG: N-acetylglucosamine-6-phosphate deacetylase [Gammaproteobacteria bacterium]RLA61123.1 MAG: N-acetylglucosamine-6-phosphate deacetylase [Gammaproteobacteria bacterium]
MPTSATEFAITAPTVFDGERLLPDHCVIVRGETVVQVLPARDCPAELDTLILDTGILAPGLIDLQVNGGGGLMLNNAPVSATVNAMAAAHRATGTTSMLPTLLSDTHEVQQAAVEAVREARTGGNAGIAGLHLEGPFFEPTRRGTHSAGMIRPPRAQDIDWLCALQDLTLIVTLAPEHAQPGQIGQLTRSGIHVCAGHTNASYQQVRDAAKQGLHGVTHLFNAMSPLTSREPGTVGAALDDDSLWAGIVADGYHVHPANIRLAHKAKPAGKLVLVTDAMATVGSDSPAFELYGEEIRESDGRLVNADGVLAGSAIGMIDAVCYVNRTVGLALEECLRMASLYPAAILKLDDKLGRVASGYRADLVHFNDDFTVYNTWLAGQRQSHT